MNRILALVLTVVLSLSAPLFAQEGKRTLKEVYASGVKLYQAGDYAAAKTEFETYLKHQPTNPYARKYLAECRQKIREGGKPVATVEAKLNGLVIPEINFDKTELGLAMDFLTQKSEELSKGQVVANFIYKGSDEQRKTPISLKLRNAPFLDVVRYVGQLSGTRFTFDAYAIVGTPVGGASDASAVSSNSTENPSPESKFDSAESTPINPGPDPFPKR